MTPRHIRSLHPSYPSSRGVGGITSPTEKFPSISPGPGSAQFPPSSIVSSRGRGGRSRTQQPAATHRGRARHSYARRRPMAASLRSPPPLAAAFRRSRVVVRASSSSSSSSSSAVSSSSSAPKARFVARRSESVPVQQLARPLGTRSLPPSRALPRLHGLYLLAG